MATAWGAGRRFRRLLCWEHALEPAARRCAFSSAALNESCHSSISLWGRSRASSGRRLSKSSQLLAQSKSLAIFPVMLDQNQLLPRIHKEFFHDSGVSADIGFVCVLLQSNFPGFGFWTGLRVGCRKLWLVVTRLFACGGFSVSCGLESVSVEECCVCVETHGTRGPIYPPFSTKVTAYGHQTPEP